MPNILNKLPEKSELNIVLSSFTKKEWSIFTAFFLVLIISTLGLLQIINTSFMISVPAHGGSLSEGIIGTPRFVNPILASSPADQDMVALIYSGLMRKNPDGILIPDLAEKYEMSTDALSYTFTLKNNLYFHDNKPLSVDDIIFTINKARDPIIKSSQKVNWDGVTMEKIDDKTIKFNLKKPYASFLENTTIGIIPAHIWNDSPIELHEANTNPIGSGPYKISTVNKQSSGAIDSYKFIAFKKFALGEPYIKNLSINFYQNEEDMLLALENGDIEQASSITPTSTLDFKEKKYPIVSSTLPRIFGLFFNQSQNQIFIDKAVVRAIDQTIDKDKIIREVLAGYGIVIDNPIPPSILQYQKLTGLKNLSREEILTKVRADLAKAGWVKNVDGFLEKTTTEKKKKVTIPLAFSISTGNIPELAKAAELIKEDLLAIGMNVDVKTFEVGNLNQSVIRPRKYDALLFGQIINHESDLYAFWHSSQRKDPGLNIALYTNAKVDKILEDTSTLTDENTRFKKYVQFEDEITKDMPAVFLYSPNFIYVVSPKIQGFTLNYTTSPSERFKNIYSWYIDTEQVWKIFVPIENRGSSILIS
jgi:peptide/nickel transport system substrate-binding protein